MCCEDVGGILLKELYPLILLSMSIESQEIMELGMVSVEPWQMWFDGSKANGLTGIGVVIKSPQRVKTTHGFRVDEITCSNNQVEYEALIMGLEILIGLQAHTVDIFGDSQLVVNQVKGIFKCQSLSMLSYYVVALHLLSQF